MGLDWITPQQAAEKWGITDRRVQVLCLNGQIDGAVRLGRGWLIPKDTLQPVDGRTKTAKESAAVADSRLDNVAYKASEINDNSELNKLLTDVTEGTKSVLRDRLLKIILYGSYARGDYNSDSDVDIMALADLSEDERRVIQKRINKIASDISLKHDITVSISLRSLNMYNIRVEYIPFYKNVHDEGVEIYAS